MKQILIVEDDIPIGNMLEETLAREGYAVVRAYSGTEALFVLRDQKPDLVLLDLMLPGLSGEELLPQIRDIPVIVVSAKADVDDKVVLLRGGAADYVTKPFDLKELLARIAVQLRGTSAVGAASERLVCGSLSLDVDIRTARVGECAVQLTRTECALLKMLMRNPGQVLTKSQILDHISADTPDCTESSLKVHISHLRTKLGTDCIEAVWGIGFRLRPEEI